MGVVVSRIWFVVRDPKGTENQVASHSSRLEDEALLEHGDKADINGMFPDVKVLVASDDLIP